MKVWGPSDGTGITDAVMVWTVAAPDRKIRQCVERSALFPGRADGGAESPEARGGTGEARHSPPH